MQLNERHDLRPLPNWQRRVNRTGYRAPVPLGKFISFLLPVFRYRNGIYQYTHVLFILVASTVYNIILRISRIQESYSLSRQSGQVSPAAAVSRSR